MSEKLNVENKDIKGSDGVPITDMLKAYKKTK
jgi:hypothetical protein